MIKTIKELIIEWWAGNATTKLPIPMIYTYEVEELNLVLIKSLFATGPFF